MFKDTILTAKRKRTELRWLVVSFAMAILLNFIAIISYDTPWKEAFTMIHVLLLVAIVIYPLILLVRLIIALISSLLRRQTT